MKAISHNRYIYNDNENYINQNIQVYAFVYTKLIVEKYHNID